MDDSQAEVGPRYRLILDLDTMPLQDGQSYVREMDWTGTIYWEGRLYFAYDFLGLREPE